MFNKVNFIDTVEKDQVDDFLILSSSWEERCLGVAQRTQNYQSKKIIINVYENKTKKKIDNLNELNILLDSKGSIQKVTAKQSNPLEASKRILYHIKENLESENPKISFDISCFTRKHLFLLFHCLEQENLLGNVNFYYSQPTDYFTDDNESITEGIEKIANIETFNGDLFSSRDTKLILFLNFEGRRALALWDELEPHLTIPIIPFPSINRNWDEKIQNQNKLLLSTLNLNSENVKKVNPINVEATEEILSELLSDEMNKDNFGNQKNYNFLIGALGTKPQMLGVFKYWRKNKNKFSIVYPSPIRYKNDDDHSFPTENVWLVDNSKLW